MLCKVVSDAREVKSFPWRLVRGSPAQGHVQPAGLSEPERAEIASLKQRLEELDRVRHSELAQLRQTAFQEGLRQGAEESSAVVKASTDQLANIVADLAAVKRKVRKEAEGELVNLSLAIARRILYRELAIDPEAIEGLVHAALQKLQNRDVTRVRIASASVDALRTCLERKGGPPVQIVPDPTLKIGDLIFDTSVGELDASVDTQLQEIHRGFADRLSSR